MTDATRKHGLQLLPSDDPHDLEIVFNESERNPIVVETIPEVLTPNLKIKSTSPLHFEETEGETVVAVNSHNNVNDDFDMSNAQMESKEYLISDNLDHTSGQSHISQHQKENHQNISKSHSNGSHSHDINHSVSDNHHGIFSFFTVKKTPSRRPSWNLTSNSKEEIEAVESVDTVFKFSKKATAKFEPPVNIGRTDWTTSGPPK